MKVKFLTILSIAAVLFIAACGKSDADLQKAVNDKLAADKVTGVTATVKNGVATLTGEAADITVKNKAESTAKGVEGIKSVDVSKVTLKPLPTPVPPVADPMLKGKAEEALKKAGCDGATVTSDGGKISIKGTVPAAKYTTCMQAISGIGAAGIDNQLQKGK